MMRRSAMAKIAFTSSLLSAAAPALYAAEGGITHYLPGVVGDLGFALPPQPGWSVANIVWNQTGEIDAIVAGGQATANLDLDLTLDIIAASYAFDRQILGGTYSVGVVVPFGHAELSGELTGPAGNTVDFTESSFGLADVAFIPFQMNWSRGNYHFELYQSIIAPIGSYDEDELVNLGLGYWSFELGGCVHLVQPGHRHRGLVRVGPDA